MKVTLLPSVTAGPPELQYLTSYRVNESVAVDAGSLGFVGSPEEQSRVKHVFLSHTHIDHTASLPIFVENAYQGTKECVVIYGSQPVLDCLRQDFFNGRVWPDLIGLSDEFRPFLKLERLESGQPCQVEGLTLTPVEMDHVVPTQGFFVADEGATVLLASDTAPTEDVWQQTAGYANLKAVFLEVTFPNDMEKLAEISKHLTPRQFGREVQKIGRDLPVYAVHLKARYRDKVARELAELNLPNVQLAVPGKEYVF